MAQHSTHPIAAAPTPPARERTARLWLRAYAVLVLVLAMCMGALNNVFGAEGVAVLLGVCTVITALIWTLSPVIRQAPAQSWPRPPWAFLGYTALAAYRFVPRFGYELSVIRAAHRVRGHGFGGRFGGRGPVARLVRGWGYVVPLLASGIRHAERVALSMDARAFGAHRTRTERHLVPWRTRDTVFVIAVVVASALVFTTTFPWQL